MVALNNPASPKPNITAKNARHMMEFEKPNTDDCQAPNTVEQLTELVKSQASGVPGLAAQSMRSMTCKNDATAPMSEPKSTASHGYFMWFLRKFIVASIVLFYAPWYSGVCL